MSKSTPETPDVDFKTQMVQIITELSKIIGECDGEPVAFVFGIVKPNFESCALITRNNVPGSNIALVGLGALIFKQVTDGAKLKSPNKDTRE